MKFLNSLFILLMCSTSFAALPYYPLVFPRDEGAHFKNIPYDYQHLVESWYFNGKLTADDGEQLGYDAALFQIAIKSGNNVLTVPMVQLQIVDLDQKKNRGGATIYKRNGGEISTTELNIKLDENNQLQKVLNDDNQSVYKLKLQTTSKENTLKLDLQLVPSVVTTLVNDTGFTNGPENSSAYYYLIPRLTTSGTVTINDKVYHISAEHGDSWFEHLWTDASIRHYGWEHLSLRLDDGTFVHTFLHVEYSTQRIEDGFGIVILPSGQTNYIPDLASKGLIQRKDYWKDPNTGDNYPQTFIIEIPSLNLHIESRSAFPEQASNNYWEGYTQVTANHNGEHVNGFGYAEMVYSVPM